MSTGWIKIHRKLLENPIYSDPHLLHLFIHCVLKANHKEQDVLFNNELVKVERGQFITGRFQLAKDLKQNPSSIYKRLITLQKLEILNIKSNNKFSMITVLKYGTYQDEMTTKEQQKEQPRNNKVTTKEQQSNTNNNDNNDNNDNNENKEIYPAKKTKNLCLFENSEFYDFGKFKESFLKNDKYKGFDVNYYYEAVKNWSASGNKMKKDWIATAHNFALTDKTPRFSRNGNVETIKLPD
jgi:hypothetical protein